MLLDNYKKQSPIVGVAGLGGGINSYIFLSGGADPYIISRSLRFNSGDSAYLSRTPSSAGNRRTWTWSGWVKRSTLGGQKLFIAGASGTEGGIQFYSGTDNNGIEVYDYSGSYTTQLDTSQLFRDVSAWYHIVLAYDTTQSTAANRVKLYINGLQVDDFATETYPSQNYEGHVNNNIAHTIGAISNPSSFFNGYLADVHFIDGQALAATDFGETDSDGVWQPKKFSGSHGTNGFYLDFKDNSSNAALGYDAAGSNNFTVNNLTATVPGLATANQGMDVVTYTGTGSAQSIGGLAFQPDFVWLKRRSATGNHCLSDSVRGFGASGSSKLIYSDATNSEDTGNTQIITAFNSDGFTLGTNGIINGSGSTHVAWCWKAGGAASSNSNGTITSSVSANTTYGFSVVTYTGNGTSGATYGHGLSNAPAFIISKRLNASNDWGVYHASIGNTGALALNLTIATDTSAAYFNNTSPTSTVVTLGNGGGFNANGGTYVNYCWSEVAGFSKISGYAGSGSSGNKITTGFRPRFLLIKGTDSTYEWQIFDSARNSSGNPINLKLEPNTSDAEASTSNSVNFYDDGFDFNSNSDKLNGSSKNYIYAAYASKPDQSAIDALIDSPAQSVADETDTGLGGQITGNYATFNPLTGNTTLSNGNLDSTGKSGYNQCLSTIGMSSGKYYCEITIDDASGGIGVGIGTKAETGSFLGNTASGYLLYTNGTKRHTGVNVSYGDSYTTGDTIGIAFDADGGNLYFYKNGTIQASGVAAFTGLTSGPYFFAVDQYNTSNEIVGNFGQRAFAHTAPSGYKCLTVENLSDPTGAAAEPNKYFDTKLYTGNASARSLTMDNSLLSPDFVWIKSRSAGSAHHLFDSIRGPGKRLISNGTQDDSYNASDSLTSFDSNGFSLGADTTTGCVNNPSGATYAAWAWDAGSSTVTNNDGSIASQVRANPSAGFSICTYTGNGGGVTIGHGLNAIPEFVATKQLNGASNWTVYAKGGTSFSELLQLNLTNAKSSIGSCWGSSSDWTTSTFGIHTGNNQGGDQVAYCFAPVEGYSAMGVYSGNGSADGVFVYTGFKPAFLLTKRTDSAENWEIRDSKRNPFNRVNKTLYPHTSGVEDNGSVDVDFLSNGFKLRTTNGSMNASGGTYMYYAVAEAPFKTVRAR